MSATKVVPPLVTFLFTDIVESTRRWESDPAAMGEALRRHDALVRALVASHDGRVFKTIGDAFCVAFDHASDAIHGALEIQAALAREDFTAVGGLFVRMAIHAGIVEARNDDYFGQPLNRVARMLGIGHGGQVLATPAAVELAQKDLREDVIIADLGAHRLRDISAPVRILQMRLASLAETFPELRSLGRGLTNLPTQGTSFVGRGADVAAVLALVASSRAVTLAGPGGVGKTRLSIAVGQELVERFPDGVWFVDLAPLVDPQLVAAQVAAKLDVRAPAGGSIADEIVNALRGKRVVFILDNCEHVLDDIAMLANDVLQRCEGVRFIATSREALSLTGEIVRRIEPLAVSDAAITSPEEAVEYGAIALFVDRAHAVNGHFRLTDANVASVVDICRRLDGIPLAIELAAPRIAILSPAELAKRLDERFRLLTTGVRGALPRQQTLRALIDWSYDLLTARERTIFRRIGAFAGGFTLEAATLVCVDDVFDEWSVLDALVALEAKSLVVADISAERTRYRLLESTRAYALEKLDESGERGAIASKHATFVAAYLVEQSTRWEAMDERGWQAAVTSELDNVRAALTWTIGASHDPGLGLRVLAPLYRPLRVMTYDEAIKWYESARDIARGHADKGLGATILRRYATICSHRAIVAEERIAVGREALEACRACDDVLGSVHAAQHLAVVLRDSGNIEEARTMLARAWSIVENHDVPFLRASLACDRALVEFDYGESARARELVDLCVAIAPAGSILQATAYALLADIAFIEGNPAAARDAAVLARVVFAEQNHVLPLAVVMCNEAAYALAMGNFDEVRSSLEPALEIIEQRNNYMWRAVALEHVALYAALCGMWPDSARLIGYCTARLNSFGIVRQPLEARGYERARTILGGVLGAAEFDRYMASGADLSDEGAGRLARAILASASAAHS